MSDETRKKLAEQFMNAGKTEEQRRNERLGKLVSEILGPMSDPFYGIPFPSVKQPEPEKPATRLVGCRSCGQVNRVPSVVVVGSCERPRYPSQGGSAR